MLNIFDWSTLGLLHKVFAVIGLVALALIILQTLLGFLGGDIDHEFDVSGDHSGTDHAWGLFSVRGMLGIMLGLGWGGLIALQKGFSGTAATFIGLGVGIVIAFCLALLMKVFHAARSDGTIDLQTPWARPAASINACLPNATASAKYKSWCRAACKCSKPAPMLRTTSCHRSTSK